MADPSHNTVMSTQDQIHYQMVSHQPDQETVFNIVNYAQPVQDEIDEGYSTNYSPSSKSTSSSFECDTSFEKSEASNSDIQVEVKERSFIISRLSHVRKYFSMLRVRLVREFRIRRET